MFHYTSFKTLKKIIESKQLLATHLQYVNDTVELMHGLNLARSNLWRYLSNAELMDATKRDLVVRVATPRMAKVEELQANLPDVFAFSMTSLADELGQWRGYTPDGSGVCIRFGPSLLQTALHGQPFTIAGVDYMHETGHKYNEGESHLVRLSPFDNPKELTDKEMKVLAAAIKDPCFRHEEETRLVHVEDGSLGRIYLDGRPRVPFSLEGAPNLAIEWIVVCPSPASDSNQASVEAYLRLQGLDRIEVRSSRLPYRPRSLGAEPHPCFAISAAYCAR